jgi:hypothetical protein
MPYADKEKQRAFQRNWKRLTKEWFWDFKSGLSCEECGICHPAVIQFHHKDKNEKKNDVSRMVNMNSNRADILTEIKKCRVLCANCHLIFHYEIDHKQYRRTTEQQPQQPISPL